MEHETTYKSISSEQQVKEWMESITKSPELIVTDRNRDIQDMPPYASVVLVVLIVGDVLQESVCGDTMP